MLWFKHQSAATNDAKIKKLIIRHGAVGYAVYFHCLELITGDFDENNITFELEHDSEIIADNLKIQGSSDKSGVAIVEEIMRTIVSLDLFTENNGHIHCFKLLKNVDSSMTSNPKLRLMIVQAKENHDTVMIRHDKVMQDETRLDEKRRDKKNMPTSQAKEQKHKHGEYSHVLLTSSELDKLKTAYPLDWEQRIKNLDEGIELKGYRYKSHYLAILKWAQRERTDTTSKPKEFHDMTPEEKRAAIDKALGRVQ